MQGKLGNADETIKQTKAELSEYGAKKRDIKAVTIFADELLLLYSSKFSKDTEISYRVGRSTGEFYVEFEIPGEEISPKDLQNEQSVFILNNIAKKMEYAVTYSYHQGKKDSYGEKHADCLIGEIKFEDVSFSYQHDDPLEEDRPILEKLNFTIPPASTTAFVGKSGCGKSTTFKLITGSHHASSGTVLLDGTDIREYDEETIKNNITMVSQKPYFFNTTVLDNLRMVKPDATMEEIKEACRKACILEDIERNPDGFNMELGEKGTRVSGGQLQRLAIARALLKECKIILFDEATSAIDNVTQDKIISVLDDLKKDHTILMVAHRLTTIRNAEKIFLLKDHMIEAEGTHDELMKTSEEYRGLYQKEA